MKNSAVVWFEQKLDDLDIEIPFGIFDQAKKMENDHKISLLEWIRENAIEVQGGWQYAGTTYTDEEIIEQYNKTFISE